MTTEQYVVTFDEATRMRKTCPCLGLYAKAVERKIASPAGALFTDAKGNDLAYVWPDDRVRWAPGGQAVVRALVGL